jgi:hypothetical protein
MDNFYFSALKDGWFNNCFEPYHLFGYIGDRELLNKELEKKSLPRKIIEIIAPRVSIASVLNSISEIDLLSSNKTTIAQDVITLVTEHENQRKITEILGQLYTKAKKEGTYYDDIANRYGGSLFDSNFNKLQSNLVTIEGQLVNKNAVPQYSKSVSSSLRVSQQEWMLADYPPHAFVDNNSSFMGKVILLDTDDGFSEAFSGLLPFNRELGWYPYVRITGFFDSSKIQTQLFPSMSVCFVEYRRPIMYRDLREKLLYFMKIEFSRINFLEEWSNLILFSYLYPILFKGSNMEPNDSDDELKSYLKKYLNNVDKNDIPISIQKFYEIL